MMQHHPKADNWRGKPCPYYEDLCIIFGKDRATGQNAQSLENIEDEVNEEAENDKAAKKDAPDAAESSSTQEPSQRVETSSVRLGKRVRISENLVRGLSAVAFILGREGL